MKRGVRNCWGSVLGCGEMCWGVGRGVGKCVGVWGEVREDVWGVWKSVTRGVGKRLIYGMSAEGVKGMLECEGRGGRCGERYEKCGN